MFELFGDQCTDLLAKENGGNDRSNGPPSSEGDQSNELSNKSENGRVDILEDVFGQIHAKGATEVRIETTDQLMRLTREAFFDNRRTASTFKNSDSSRSHAICVFRVENLKLSKVAADGYIFLVDLAGSENSLDSMFHDQDQMVETRVINTSLMAVKECARNRALSCLNPSKFYHIPYRQSKLTLLLKDALELKVKRHSKTVVLANLSPSCADLQASLATLKFAASIRVDGKAVKKVKLAPNPDNPVNWSHDRLSDWIKVKARGKVDPAVLCPGGESGAKISRLPQSVLLERVLADPANQWGEKQAMAFYCDFWQLLVDARTQERKEKLQRKILSTNDVYGKVPEGMVDMFGSDVDKAKKKPPINVKTKAPKFLKDTTNINPN